MSMQGNPHVVEAGVALDAEAQQGASYLNPQDAMLRVAAIEATLALAFEQRTASLVSFCGLIPRGAMDEDTIRLRNDIMERLGLK
jgi:hypothetical protein